MMDTQMRMKCMNNIVGIDLVKLELEIVPPIANPASHDSSATTPVTPLPTPPPPTDPSEPPTALASSLKGLVTTEGVVSVNDF